MTDDPTPEPPAINMSFGPMPDGITRAGTPDEQIAAQDLAWTILETLALPGLRPWAMLSQDWLGTNDLRVQLLNHEDTLNTEGEMEPLVTALRRRGIGSLLGTFVSPDAGRPSAVWRVPAEARAIGLFMQELYYGFHILFPENLSFAILADDGSYAVLAGPESFLREALPPEMIGPRATAALVDELERLDGPGTLGPVLAHYAPFLLD